MPRVRVPWWREGDVPPGTAFAPPIHPLPPAESGHRRVLQIPRAALHNKRVSWPPRTAQDRSGATSAPVRGIP